MFDNADKRKLYWLIDEYLAKRITSTEFCDKFYYCFDLELDFSLLSKEEYLVFSSLGKIVGRFSQFDKDIEEHPGVYVTESELREKIAEAKALLT